MDEHEIALTIQNALIDLRYGDEPFDILIEPEVDGYRPDMIIKARKRCIAALEIKMQETLTRASSSFDTSLYFTLKVRFFVYTDGERFYMYDRLGSPAKPIKTNKAGFVRRITTRITQERLRKVKKLAADTIRDLVGQASDSFPRLRELLEVHGNQIERQLKLSYDYALYFDGGTNDTDSFEHQFFRRLLDNNVPNSIYRYYSFARAFQVINDNTIAMQGLSGMNDTTEPNYAENYLNGPDKEEVWEMSPQSRAAINRRFIMSCTELQDDLMQWRLYGEDGKGACLEFEVSKTLEGNQQFFLGRVKYADEHGKHPELLFLRNIIQQIRSRFCLNIRFVLFYGWRHFFKPREYEYEKEIRLLYIHKRRDREKEWIAAEPYSIVNPMVKFDLSSRDFPLAIKGVMLGPKRPESKLNKSQLIQMTVEKRRHYSISESTKNIYR